MRINGCNLSGGSFDLGGLLMFIALRHSDIFPMALTMGMDGGIMRLIELGRYEVLYDRFGCDFMVAMFDYFMSCGNSVEAYNIDVTLAAMQLDIELIWDYD